MKSALSVFEKYLCKTHTRIEIKGKRGRKVPVLLTEEMKKNITVLIQPRDVAKVQQEYLFARPGMAEHPYRGSDCLRKFAQECNAKLPQCLMSTKL